MTSHHQKPTGAPSSNASQSKQGELMSNLLQHADERESAPDATKQRIKHQLHVQWQQNVQQRKQKKLWWFSGGLATAMSVVLVAFNFNWSNAPELTASVYLDALQGTVNSNRADIIKRTGQGNGRNASEQAVLTPGTMLETLDDGFVTLTLETGGNLRLNHNSQLIVEGDNRFTLSFGTLYFESDVNRRNRSPIAVTTVHGTIEDIGTQFEVVTDRDSLQISVREGLVNLNNDRLQRTLVAGRQLLKTTSGQIEETAIASDDPRWQWVNQLAPKFELEGKNLHQFLRWISREHGLELSFDQAHSENLSRLLTLHGDIEGLTLEQALTTVLATTEFDYRIEASQLLVCVR